MSLEKVCFEVVVDCGCCCGYGFCVVICFSIYKLDDDGLVYVDSKIVFVELEEEVCEGVVVCLVEVIWFEDFKFDIE